MCGISERYPGDGYGRVMPWIRGAGFTDGPRDILREHGERNDAADDRALIIEGFLRANMETHEREQPKRAVVLLSGGLDSTTTLAIAKSAGYEVYALSFRYGQRHEVELEAARRVAERFGVAQHVIADIDLRLFGGSALTADIAVPKGRPVEEMGAGIPITYVPARNTIFLSFALAWAEVLGASDIFIGVNVYDYSVSGNANVWVRTCEWPRLMSIENFWQLPKGNYETMSVDPVSYKIAWHRVSGRLRHNSSAKRCFNITLERGQNIAITEDHSLFTIDVATARLTPVKGSQIVKGMPIITPFDLSSCANAWADDLRTLDLRQIVSRRLEKRRSLIVHDDYVTNRLCRTRIPVDFPITDDFLYIVGLWLAEGGKEPETESTRLALSVGGIPGAVETLRTYFDSYGVKVAKSPLNDYDYAICSSVFDALFYHLGLFGTAKKGNKKFPGFFWVLSQRQRRVLIAGFWDGDGAHVQNGEAVLAQKSHALVHDLYHCLSLDGIFPVVKFGQHKQKLLVLGRAMDFAAFADLYPLRHPSKLASLEAAGALKGKDKVTGLWKCEGLWSAVSAAALPVGRKTAVYNTGGKYDESVRAQRSAFIEVPVLQDLAMSKLAFLRVVGIEETSTDYMYDLSVEGAENFIANGILAHNSGYPDCRPEYIEAYERMANLATKAGVEGRQRLEIHTPLIALTKAQIIRRGLELGVDYALTVTCYDPSPTGEACGQCDACQLRLKGFAENGISDPARYQAEPKS